VLLVFGLDGATFRLAGPWMDAGKLPTLAALRARGRWGRLQSTIPPATLPSWTTFMTGVNPGRHGIFDFTRREPGRYDVRFVNSTFRKVPSIWRQLSDFGKRVAVLGMPGTYPPEEINGCMVSGFDAPVTTRATRSFIRPRALADEIMRLGGFTFADFQEFRVGPGWYRSALSRLLQGVGRKRNLARALLRREPWDCLCLVFGETDTVAHHFWHFYDRRSPRHDPRAAVQFGDSMELVYRAVDDAIGELLACAPPGTDVLIASDHGFGGAGAKAIHLNRFLEKRGWLSFEGGRAGIAGLAKRAALRLVPAAWQGHAFRAFGGTLANRMESRARFGNIAWQRTRAFSEELNYFPSIHINRAGRETYGLVTDAQYDGVCAEITAQLLSWRDPETGAGVVRRVCRRDEVYDGPWTQYAPDLILELEEDDGFSYCALSSEGQPGVELRRLHARELVGGKRFSMSGSHRADGMFILAARDVETGRTSASIADMAPTILSLCGVPVPGHMEGVSLASPWGGALVAPPAAAGSAEDFYSEADEQILEERLRALGYLA
jgi:predicted AlkP superfamily phosphohydrolase/phosphomutase